MATCGVRYRRAQFHAGVRRVIANAVEWAVTLRPRRETPVLLRHSTEDFYRGFDYTGADCAGCRCAAFCPTC